jgi:hypothetical protein
VPCNESDAVSSHSRSLLPFTFDIDECVFALRGTLAIHSFKHSCELRLDIITRIIVLPIMNTALKSQLRKRFPIASSKLNLFQLCALLPRDGVEAKVKPLEWTLAEHGKNQSNTKDNYYLLTHVRLSPGYTQGIVSGIRYVNGKQVDTLPRAIPQDLSAQTWIQHKESNQ